ncbi:PREDICTED: beclin-2 [Condylura cristata]|uniref:beclin-2 n=1 Tax=Condylura cristata TaxID=143302 RepID=UPI0003344BE8|nr:PREDICTED: beclin-2 [Condylura cristata]
MSSIRFLCQHCHQPLKLSQSPAVWKLTSAHWEWGEAQEGSAVSWRDSGIGNIQYGASGRTLSGGGRASRDSPHSYILLGKFGSTTTLHSIQKFTGDIFDILSSEKDVDHPLCQNCTDRLLEQLDTEITITESESQSYRCLLESKQEAGPDETEALQDALKELELEEARLVQELEEVERSRDTAAAELEAAQAETEMLEQQEILDQREHSFLQWQHLELLDELRSVENQLCHAQNQQARLEKTNIFRATFEICEDGPLGIINNFRLGSLPRAHVCWSEINAAWGQTALLLLALSNAIGLKFQRYQLVPRGSHSYLKPLSAEDAVELPLFRGGGTSRSVDDQFDRAMMAFLDCMHQFKEEAGKGKVGLCFPYRIHVEKGLMEEPGGSRKFYSIRTYRNTEEQWTKALKLMLINFKWSLDWVSLRYHQK